MTDASDFSGLVHEAFIEPIRSVLIVDDQYPTWEETLNDTLPDGMRDDKLHTRSAAKNWRNTGNSPAALIEQFRTQKPALIVDIHDAAKRVNSGPLPAEGETADNEPQHDQSSELAQHLHQSDFLVLDYELEGPETGLKGTLAREILQSVLCNQHFNLILLHTSTDTETTFAECVQSLLVPCYPDFGEKKKQKIAQLQDSLADETAFSSGEFKNCLDMNSYIALRHPHTTLQAQLGLYMKGDGPAKPLWDYAEGLNLAKGLRPAFLLHAIHEYEKVAEQQMATKPVSDLNWSEGVGRKWLRTSRGFVGFVKKGPTDLLAELRQSIEAWKPTPSRLLSAKFRHEISCNGVEAEDRTLSKHHVFAQFYDELCKAKTDEKRGQIFQEQVTRQTETLAWQVSDAVTQFGEKIYSVDTAKPNGFSDHYGVKLSDPEIAQKAVSHYNCYVSTLPLKEGDPNLDCGHIFKYENEFWLCATPACDMQPGQNAIAFARGESDVPNLRAFKALKLSAIKPEKLTPEHINSNAYCFVEGDDGEVMAYGLKPFPKVKSPPHTSTQSATVAATACGQATTASATEYAAMDAVPAPSSVATVSSGEERAPPEPETVKETWRIFFAKNDGRLSGRELGLVSVKIVGEDLRSTTNKSAEILGKLRYEYALNYLQRVGISVTRIGLGYVTKSPE